MNLQGPISLFISDAAVLSSLQFSLSLDGFQVAEGASSSRGIDAAAVLIVDQAFEGDGLAALRAIRGAGHRTPAIVLATNPTPRTHSQVAELGAAVVEKPLLGDELTCALRHALAYRKAA